MLNDFLKLIRGVSLVVALFILQRAFFSEFAAVRPALASAQTQQIVLWVLLFIGVVFYAAIDDGDWVFNSFALLMVLALMSLLFPSYDVLSLQRNGSLSDGLFLRSLIALAVMLAGGFAGSQLRSVAHRWRPFDNRLAKVKSSSRGLHTFWKGQRSLIDWFRYPVVVVGVVLGALAYVVFQLGLSVFGRGVYPELLLSGYIVLSSYLVFLAVAWFRCSPNVAKLGWKYLAHCIGFLLFALLFSWSLPILNTALLVTQYVN